MNTKTRKLFDQLKGKYDITVGTDHPQYAEPSYPIIKCAKFNRRPIQNCTSIYQMKICTVGSASIISRRPFLSIKGSRSIDPIDYLICNKCEVHLSDEDSDELNGPQFIWPAFIGVFYTDKTSPIIILLGIFEILFLWNGVDCGLMKLYTNLRHITTLF